MDRTSGDNGEYGDYLPSLLNSLFSSVHKVFKGWKPPEDPVRPEPEEAEVEVEGHTVLSEPDRLEDRTPLSTPVSLLNSVGSGQESLMQEDIEKKLVESGIKQGAKLVVDGRNTARLAERFR